MKFEVDNQTLKDLEIFETIKNGKSVFDLLNCTRCYGGKNRLYEILSKPLTNLKDINERKDAIAFFASNEISSKLEIDKNSLDFIEHYLNEGNYPTKHPSGISVIERAIRYKIKPSNEYYIIERGIDYTIDLLNSIHDFCLALKEIDLPLLIQKLSEEVFRLFALAEYEKIAKIKKMKKLSALEVGKFDYMFRYTHKEQIRFFIHFIYEIDVFTSVAKTANKYNFSYPEILSSQEEKIEIEELFHPFITAPILNNIHFTPSGNLAFISGPNMAGKSTFLKSLGIAVYLAHTGLPVPARKMSISLLSGLYTTINIPDNLNFGHSHFYSEVLRIKYIAEKLKTNRNMLVIFDELFRGTNVKDAFDGSLAIISAFSEIKSCFYAVSTHVTEVAEQLKEKENIQFCFFEVLHQNTIPTYTYKLKKGISACRLGMYIIEKEQIIDIINSINKN